MQQNLELRQWLRQLRREETLNSQQGEDAGLGLGEAHLGASRLCQRTPISVHGFNPISLCSQREPANRIC